MKTLLILKIRFYLIKHKLIVATFKYRKTALLSLFIVINLPILMLLDSKDSKQISIEKVHRKVLRDMSKELNLKNKTQPINIGHEDKAINPMVAKYLNMTPQELYFSLVKEKMLMKLPNIDVPTILLILIKEGYIDINEQLGEGNSIYYTPLYATVFTDKKLTLEQAKEFLDLGAKVLNSWHSLIADIKNIELITLLLENSEIGEKHPEKLLLSAVISLNSELVSFILSSEQKLINLDISRQSTRSILGLINSKSVNLRRFYQYQELSPSDKKEMIEAGNKISTIMREMLVMDKITPHEKLDMKSQIKQLDEIVTALNKEL